MSDVPIGPGGIPNPFGFDLQQLMRMLQSQGPVNFEIAQQVAATGRDRATRDRRTGPRAHDRSDRCARASTTSCARPR